MLELLTTYWPDLLVILIMVAVLGLLYKKGKRQQVAQIILSLVVKAEKRLGSGTGELKYATVVEELYSLLPGIIRFLYSEKDIDQMIEAGVKTLKKHLEKGVNLVGYEEELYFINPGGNSLG